MSVRLSHLALQVTDLDASVAFATEVCHLRVTRREEGATFLSTGERHHELVLREGKDAWCQHIGFEVEGEDELGAVRSLVESECLDVLEPQTGKLGIDQAFQFRGPDGQVFEVLTGMEKVAMSELEFADPLRPRAFGHVSMKSPEPGRLEEFLVRVLGMRVSDRVGAQAMWLRADAQHHAIALMREPAGIHHYAFEIAGWTSLEHHADHLRACGHTIIWGPGRHGPGNNLFAYFLDPEGCVIEYYAELEQIKDEELHQPGDWPGTPGTFNLWGPGPPPGWHDNGLLYAGESDDDEAMTAGTPGAVGQQKSGQT